MCKRGLNSFRYWKVSRKKKSIKRKTVTSRQLRSKAASWMRKAFSQRRGDCGIR